MDRDLSNFRRPRVRQRVVAVDSFVAARHNHRKPHSASTIRLATQQASPAVKEKPTPKLKPKKARQKLAGILPLDMSLPGTASRKRILPVFKINRFRGVRVWMLRIAVACMVITVGGGSSLATFNYWKIRQVFGGGHATTVALEKNVKPELLGSEGSGRINILLLGNGGGTHDGPDLTDTMIVASIDPVNYRADLVSIPRDMWVSVAGYGSMKINAVYETGKYAYLHRIDSSNANHEAVKAGMDMADRSVEDVLGITINYNVLVNFQAFSQVVDTIGGVTVNVPEDLYDPTMAWENNWNPLLAKAGVQTMDGKHALIYARSRETTSDFARGQRQRALLMALKDKILTLGTLSSPLKISQLVGAFGDNAVSDLSLGDLSRLASVAKGITGDKVQSIGLTDAPYSYVTTDHVGAQSVVRPLAGFSNYAAIQTYIRSILVDGYIVKEHARVVVLDGGVGSGLVQQKADELKTYGYGVTRVGTAPNSAKTVIVDLTSGKDKYTAHYLQERFGVRPTSVIPDKAIQTAQADFIIILGHDETSSSQD